MLNYLPFVPTCLTCLRFSSYYVPTCLKLLRTYVPSFSRAFMCLRDNIYSSCLKLFRAYVRSFFNCLRACNQSQSILRLTSITLIVAFLWIIWSFVPFKTPKQTPSSKTAYCMRSHLLRFFPCHMVRVQRQYFEDPLRNNLKQWTFSSILNSY